MRIAPLQAGLPRRSPCSARGGGVELSGYRRLNVSATEGIFIVGTLLAFCALTALCGMDGGVVLDNGAIRVELDPVTYSVRFLGRPGGPNFVDPLYMTPWQRRPGALVMPGGIMSDVLPVREDRAFLRRGPAAVLEQRRDYVLLMGPACGETQLQVKSEYLLDRNAPELTYRLSVLSSRRAGQTVAIRVTAQVPWAGALAFPAHGDGVPGLIRGAFPGYPGALAAEDGKHRLPLGVQRGREQAVLRAPVAQLEVTRPSGTWARGAALISAGEGEETNVELLVLLDDQSQTCQIALEARQTGVNVGVPMVFVETWRLEEAPSMSEDFAPAAGRAWE